MDDKNQDNLTTCADRLKQVRRQLRFKQKEFAAKMDISASYLSELETGKTRPGYNFLRILAEMFDISSDYLLHGIGGMFLEMDNPNVVELDFGDQTRQIKEMLEYFKVSPLVRLTVMAYTSRFMLSNEDIIKKDIEKSNGKAQK